MRFMPYSSSFRTRKFQKNIDNLRVSVLCFLLTVLVLRNTIGAGKFGTPAQDFEELRYHFHQVSLRRKQARVLAEVVEDRSRTGTLPIIVEPNDALQKQASRVLLVTPFDIRGSSCHAPRSSIYETKVLRSKIEYCSLHGCDIFDSSSRDVSNIYDPDYVELRILKEALLANPDVLWIWWMDADTAITDMSFEFPFSSYSRFHLILSGYGGNKINSGNFLIKNSEWSLNLLQDFSRFQSGSGEGFSDKSRTSAFAYYLDKHKLIHHDKVHFDDSSFLSEIWINMKMDLYHKKLPFTVNFMGCKRCSELDACINQMDQLLINV